MHQPFPFAMVALFSAVALSACGGGGGVAPLPSPTPASAPAQNTSTTTPTPPSTNGGGNTEGTDTGTITKQKISTCPQTTMTPVDMSKLNCLVGSFTGVEYKIVAGIDVESWPSTGQPCSFSLSSKGLFTGNFSTGTTTENMSPQALGAITPQSIGSIYEVGMENGAYGGGIVNSSAFNVTVFGTEHRGGKAYFVGGIVSKQTGEGMSCWMAL